MNKIFIQKHKKLILSGLIALGALLVLFTSIAGYYFYYINTPANKKGTEITFVVQKGDGVRKVSMNLEKDKIISQDLTFMIYLKLSGLSGNIQAGDYRLSPAMSPLTVADILTMGKVASKKITIPEGWTVDDIGTYLEKQGVCKKADFLIATKESYNYDFLADKPVGQGLEGYLFPDTYQISATSSPEQVIKLMLDNFGTKLTPELRAAIAGSKMNIHEVITLSSIVEREANKPTDRKVVAGIFESRLDEGMKLQSDVTVAYALSEDKKDLTAADLLLDSPYNTYVTPGLPIGPICNPGLESINAVIYPEITSFRYFIAVKDQMYYAKTIEEHNENIAKYLK